MPTTQIETPTNSHVVRYPQAEKAAIEQMAIFWPAEELGVEEDESDFHNNLTEGEKHGVLELQRILTHLENIIGGKDLWGGRIPELFPRPEIERMCAVFAMMEKNSHAPFYRIGNEIMGNSTDEFYNEWEDIPVLREHTEYVIAMSKSDDALEVTASLTFLEGVVLFAAFAFFKSFNSRGFNIIPHFVSGIDASAKDENFHAMGSSWLFNQCLLERKVAGLIPEKDTHYSNVIRKIAQGTHDHENAIIDLIYSYKPETIRTITKEEMRHFIRDRVNYCLGLFNEPPMFDEPTGVISELFYDNLNKYKHSDFFATTQVQYTKNWARYKLTFRKELINEF